MRQENKRTGQTGYLSGAFSKTYKSQQKNAPAILPGKNDEQRP